MSTTGNNPSATNNHIPRAQAQQRTDQQGKVVTLVHRYLITPKWSGSPDVVAYIPLPVSNELPERISKRLGPARVLLPAYSKSTNGTTAKVLRTPGRGRNRPVMRAVASVFNGILGGLCDSGVDFRASKRSEVKRSFY